jgi:hypothetical protein
LHIIFGAIWVGPALFLPIISVPAGVAPVVRLRWGRLDTLFNIGRAMVVGFVDAMAFVRFVWERVGVRMGVRSRDVKALSPESVGGTRV